MGTLITAGQDLTASLLNQYYGNADTTATTVTQAAATALTTSYSIPANEVAVGSAYTVDFAGNGAWGSTQQALVFTVTIGSVSALGNITIGAQAFAASAAFKFAGTARIVWAASGVSGNAMVSLMINLSQTANNIAPPGSYTQGNFQAANSIGAADSLTNVTGAIDTTASEAVLVKAAWNATTGAPTLTNRMTIFRKVA